MNTILQAIKLAPRFLWQIYFQPSKVYEFIISGKKNAFTYIISSYFQGLFSGIILAIPHYLWYNSIEESLIFAVAVAVAVAVALVFAFAGAGTSAGAGAVAGAGAFAVVGASAGEFAVAVAVAFAVASAGAFAVAVVGAVAVAFVGAVVVVGDYYRKNFYNYLNKIKKNRPYVYFFIDQIIPKLFILSILILTNNAIYGKRSVELNNFIQIIPLSALAGYLLSSSLFSARMKYDFKQLVTTAMPLKRQPYQPNFKQRQIESLIWGPIIAISAFFPIFTDSVVPPTNLPVLIIAIGFLIIPLFINHIPDYLLCLPVWHRQREFILKQADNPAELIKSYKKSLIFTQEMIHFPFPGLNKIIDAIAKNKQLGIHEAVKRISHLYLYTFQQKTALKALKNLWKDKENDHRLIHYLLETRNIAMIEILTDNKPIIVPYLNLVELLSNEKKEKPDQLKLDEDLAAVCRDMEKMNDHNHTPEMVYSLDTARKLIAAGSIKDIYGAVGVLEIKVHFTDDLDYFKILNNTAAQLIQIKKDLKKAENIESIDTKRTVLRDQQKRLEELTASTTAALYDPFETIWKKALTNCSRVIETEIDQLQGSAVFDVRLVNQELRIDHLPPAAKGAFLKSRPLGSPEKLLTKQMVYFDVTNKGRELGRDVTFSIQTDGTALATPDHQPHVIDFFETGHSKKIQFPVTVHNPGKATIKLHLTYSDRTRENKQEIFSFPITITEKHTRFKKIENPYTAGPALDSSSPLFMGRNDIYQFIDKNILPTGQQQHHTIVCHGLRRTGKSSLLYHIQNRGFTDLRLVPINIDLQGTADEKDLYLTLSEKILQTLPLSSDNPQPVDNFGDFKRFIHALTPAHNKIPVLMLDEFEELQMRVQDNRISRSVFSNLRHLMQHQDHIIFIFCGTHKIEEMKADYWSIFFNTALYRRVGSLAKTDAIRLIREPVKDHLNYDELAVEHILTMTGRQPYLIQLICRTIVNDLNNTKKRNDALINDVEAAVEQIIAEDNDNFSKEAWKKAGNLERMILSATAEELTHQHIEQVHLEDILDKVAPLVLDFTREAGTDTLDQLVTHEILTEKNLNYRFTIDMMRKWIALKHPLRKVRG